MSIFSLLFTPWAICFGILTYIFYKWLTSKNDFFEKNNIPCESPTTFLLLFLKTLFGFGDNIFNSSLKSYANFPNDKLFGIYVFEQKRWLAIKDPDMIKQVTVKNFDHFINHRPLIKGDNEPLFSNTLFSLCDQKWKDMRKTLSPAFTGSKLRQMFELVEKCCKEASVYLKNEAKKSGGSIEVNTKDLFTRLANDVIATTAFGLDINSLTDRDNVFFKIGQKLTTLTWREFLKMFVISTFTRVAMFLNLKVFDERRLSYFKEIVLNTMKHRIENNIKRNDLINILIEAKNENPNWTEDDLVAQCFSFFFAGFETTATIMCFCLHELMENPEVQKKLIKEVDDFRSELDGKPLTYDVLKKMKYLDMVMSETLRKWPINLVLDRVCNKSCILEDSETGKSIEIPVGLIVTVPVVGIQYDPKYYPNPKKFDPERFSEENKQKIDPFTFLTFGAGPRTCIGNRFVLMEAKAVLFHLLSEFTFEHSPKTPAPMKLTSSAFLRPVGGFWIKFQPRE